MHSSQNSSQIKDKRKDSEHFSHQKEKMQEKDRHLRSSEHIFLDKITDFKDTQHLESSQKDGKSKNTNRRNEKKSFLDLNSSSFKDRNEVTNSADKINKNYTKLNSSNKFDVDEYQGLSYLNQKSSPIRSEDTNVTENDNDPYKAAKKKSVDIDFRMKYKTEIFKFWELNKECRYGNNCAFAHGVDDIRSKVNISTNYKTKKCKQFFDTGYCPYGSRCQFLHNELRKLSSPKPNDLFNSKNLSYRRILESFVKKLLFSQLEEKENTNKSRPRLKTFTLITNNYSINPKINKWYSTPYLIEVEGYNKINYNNYIPNEEIVSINSMDSLENLTIDCLMSAPSSESHEQ